MEPSAGSKHPDAGTLTGKRAPWRQNLLLLMIVIRRMISQKVPLFKRFFSVDSSKIPKVYG